jgi:hypothetical protein
MRATHKAACVVIVIVAALFATSCFKTNEVWRGIRASSLGAAPDPLIDR